MDESLSLSEAIILSDCPEYHCLNTTKFMEVRSISWFVEDIKTGIMTTNVKVLSFLNC